MWVLLTDLVTLLQQDEVPVKQAGAEYKKPQPVIGTEVFAGCFAEIG